MLPEILKGLTLLAVVAWSVWFIFWLINKRNEIVPAGSQEKAVIDKFLYELMVPDNIETLIDEWFHRAYQIHERIILTETPVAIDVKLAWNKVLREVWDEDTIPDILEQLLCDIRDGNPVYVIGGKDNLIVDPETGRIIRGRSDLGIARIDFAKD